MREKAFFTALLIAVGELGIPAQAQNPTPDDLARRAIERRAVEAVNWG
jgi:hypothetical protein